MFSGFCVIDNVNILASVDRNKQDIHYIVFLVKADQKADEERKQRAEEERLYREEEMRDIAIKLRKR